MKKPLAASQPVTDRLPPPLQFPAPTSEGKLPSLSQGGRPVQLTHYDTVGVDFSPAASDTPSVLFPDEPSPQKPSPI